MWHRYTAYAGVVVASIGGAAWTGQQAGEQGSRAARTEVSRQLIRGCERSNVRVRESNARARKHVLQDRAIALIASTAAEARRRGFREQGGEFQLVAARRYERAERLVRSIKFEPLPLTNCQKAYGDHR